MSDPAPGVSFAAPLFTLPLPSGAAWTVTLSDAMVAFGLLLLLLEVQKSARPGGKYLTDHLLALLIFAGAAAEFMLLPQFANATFFMLTLIALVDFLSGIALRGRRRRPVRETAIREPVPEAVAVQEMPPVVMAYDLAPPYPSETRARSDSSEPLPPRVEPVIGVDPMRDEPKVPVRPPAPQV